MRENMNTRVRRRKDLKSVTVPFIGEIPLFTIKKKRIFGKKPQEVKAVIVKEGNRDTVSYTHLDVYKRQEQYFLLHEKPQSHV